MKRRYSHLLVLAMAVLCFPMLTAQVRADTQAELTAALKKIDMKLYEQCEADVRAWLDARIARYGDFGVYPDLLGHARIEGDRAHFNLSRGGICDAGAQFFRAYEMLGDKKYLAQALKTADALLAVQQPNGHFAGGPHTVDRNGRVSVGGDRNYARIQDGSQFRPFAYVLYAYRHTGRKKYFDAARRCADLFVKHIQDAKYGWCGDAYNAGALRRHKHYESDGGSYNDYATTDPMRMTIMIYHLTRDKKYLVRTAKIGQWIFDTQLGKGKVRGWCQQYKADNTPASARGFEGAVIGPRTFNRFISPMLTWFYGMTGEERYRKLLAESYRWLKAQEHPDDYPLGGGWAYQYLPDGSEVFTWRGKIYRYDRPKTWPREWANAPWKKINRAKVQVTDTEKVLAQLKAGGREALRKWYSGPKKYSPQEYLAVRLAAARRCSDEDLVVPVRGKSLAEGVNGRVMGKYLQRVRRRLARPDAPGLPKEGTLHGRKGLDRQSWHSIHTWNEPYRPPYGWAQWQYVWDVRLATGKIDPDTAVTGGRGLEVMHYWPRWDVQGDWTTRAVEVEDWMDVPLGPAAAKPLPVPATGR